MSGTVMRLLDGCVDDTLRFLRRECVEKIPSVDINLVQVRRAPTPIFFGGVVCIERQEQKGTDQ